jgi:hypothetical protein
MNAHLDSLLDVIASFWDAGWTVRLGDEMNGTKAEATFRPEELDRAASWLAARACEHYPDSQFARWPAVWPTRLSNEAVRSLTHSVRPGRYKDVSARGVAEANQLWRHPVRSTSAKDHGLLGFSVLLLLICVAKLVGALMYWETSL